MTTVLRIEVRNLYTQRQMMPDFDAWIIESVTRYQSHGSHSKVYWNEKAWDTLENATGYVYASDADKEAHNIPDEAKARVVKRRIHPHLTWVSRNHLRK